MSNAYSVFPGDKILLVGEGNFSFSKDFVNLNRKIVQDKSAHIVTSCRECNFDTNSELKQQTVKFLEEQGVSVIFNVDATKLKCHPKIKNDTFTKIIFNFPHVGGKMKIHLNRELLKDFFSSASDVLHDGGSVIVALCDGQGGTEADQKQRGWKDSWQITEMAAFSDFILADVEQFDPSCFPNYVNMGYRSMDKSFHNNNAVVHIFKKSQPPQILLKNYEHIFADEFSNDDLIYLFLNDSLSNPLSNVQSATNYVIEFIKERLGKDFQMHSSILSYYSRSVPDEMTGDWFHLSMEINQNAILDIVKTVEKENPDYDNIFVRVNKLTKPVCLKSFSSAAVRCQMIMTGRRLSVPMIYELISEILRFFNSEFLLNMARIDDSNTVIYVYSNSHQQEQCAIVHSFLSPTDTFHHVVNVDELAQILFKLHEWRMLWAGEVEHSRNSPSKFYPASLFPKSHTFDMSLSVPLHLNDCFEDRLYMTLWLIAGDIIVDAFCLSTYLPSDRPLACYCYRITYKSYKAPLHRKRVIYIHEKIITKLIAESLCVNEG